jgi:hypothetical protein
MALTEYNSYRITPGRWNPWTPEDLQAMQIADAQIEAEFVAARTARAADKRRRDRASNPSACRRVGNSEEARARKLERNREYARTHRYEINQRRQERIQSDPEFAERLKTYNRGYWRAKYSKAAKIAKQTKEEST